MNYQDYKDARDAAWKTLVDSGMSRLPVDVRTICRYLNCRLYSYQAGARIIAAFGLTEQIRCAAGFTVLYRGVPYIFYDDRISEDEQRFTIAHELGHIVLGHIGDGEYILFRRGRSNGADETQADQFASRLLAPACVLHALGAVSTEQISSLCGTSRQSAKTRARRMRQLRVRDRFLTHELERAVMKQFQGFIKSRLESQ